MMTVDVELFGQIALDKQRRFTLSLPSPIPVSDVAHIIGVNIEEVGLVTIDGVQSSNQDIVPLSCRLCFFPPMTGG